MSSSGSLCRHPPKLASNAALDPDDHQNGHENIGQNPLKLNGRGGKERVLLNILSMFPSPSEFPAVLWSFATISIYDGQSVIQRICSDSLLASLQQRPACKVAINEQYNITTECTHNEKDIDAKHFLHATMTFSQSMVVWVLIFIDLRITVA